MPSEECVLIVGGLCDAEASPLLFGKRWGQELLKLTTEHLRALHQGKMLAVDVRNEHVLFIELDNKERGTI